MEFNNIYAHGVVRLAGATFEVELGNPLANAKKITELCRAAADSHCAVVVFPKDCLTGTTLGDWSGNASVAGTIAPALDFIANETAELGLLAVLGMHYEGVSRAVSVCGGMVFTEADAPQGLKAANLSGLRVLPVVGDGLSEVLAFNRFGEGATVIAQLLAEPRTVGMPRRAHQSARVLSRELHAAVVLSLGSRGESSTDAAYPAGVFIAADGEVLASEEHLGAAGLTVADVILPELAGGKTSSLLEFDPVTDWEDFAVNMDLDEAIPLAEPPAQRPLVPASPGRYRRDLREAFQIQRSALVRRLRATGNSRIILGVSGGLDSTLALLVARGAKADFCRENPDIEAADSTLGRGDILTFTLPGFATTAHTKDNAQKLAAATGASCEVIDIRSSATEMLKALGHPAGAGEPVYDVTFENVQAGLRADYLFRLANQRGGFVLGTGDLSEAALGWCTYGVGDHMSHYHINAGVPKSLMPDLIREASEVLIQEGLVADPSALQDTVWSIINTDVTPELIPDHADESGEVKHQTTEDSIGPYLLHDFFIYHTLRGADPQLVAFLALAAFTSDSLPEDAPRFPPDVVLHWLKVFYRRFLTQQFKRSAAVDGPIIWEGMSLSPRTGFRFPSDLNAACVDAVLAKLDGLH